MQKYNSLLVWVCVAGFILGLAGCSESDSLASGKRLLSAVQKAQNDIERAMLFMTSTGPGMKMVPEVLEVLTGAHKSLSSAISATPAAGAEIKSLANQTIGRISSMQGQYHGAAMDESAGLARRSLDELTQVTGRLANQLGMVNYYERLSKLDLSDLEKILADANSETSDLELQSRRIQSQLDKLKQQYDQLIAANKELELNAKLLRQGLSDSAGRDVLEKALAMEKEVVANAGEISKLENQISQTESSALKLVMELAASKKRVEFIGQDRTSRTQQAEIGSRTRDKMAGEISASKRDVSQRLANVVVNLRKVNDAKKNAIRHLTLPAVSGQKSSQVLATQAQMLSAVGSVRTRAILLGQHAQLVAKTVRDTFAKADSSAPAGLNHLTLPLTTERSAAVENYKSSADLFEKAARAARQGRWEFQIQQAEAMIGQYRLTAGRELIEPVVTLLAQATENATSDEDKLAVQQVTRMFRTEVIISDPQAVDQLSKPAQPEPDADAEVEADAAETDADTETETDTDIDAEPAADE